MLLTVELTHHPETPSNAVRAIEGHVCWTNESLELKFLLTGDLSRLLIPAMRSPGRADRLWEHTCFEAFLAQNERSKYCEFNFAPSREWAIYFFHSYRDGKACENPDLAPSITVESASGHLQLDALIRPGKFSREAELRLGLSAVIEEQHGILSYWALKHPPGKPDFHHADGFALSLPVADGEIINRSAADE